MPLAGTQARGVAHAALVMIEGRHERPEHSLLVRHEAVRGQHARGGEALERCLERVHLGAERQGLTHLEKRCERGEQLTQRLRGARGQLHQQLARELQHAWQPLPARCRGHGCR